MQVSPDGLLPHQREALRVAMSGAPGELVKVALVGGLSSGKTEACVHLALAVGKENGPSPVVLIAHDRPVIAEIHLPKIRKALARRGVEEGVGWRYVRERGAVEVADDEVGHFEILLRAAHGEDRYRLWPYRTGAVIIDEPADMPVDVFIGGLVSARHPGARHLVFLAAGTPGDNDAPGSEEASAFYRFANDPGTHLIRASTLDNTKLCGGPERFVKDFLGLLSEQETRRYVHGHFA